MVVIFGWGADARDLGEVAPAICPNCRNTVFFHQIRSEKRVSLYFVPLVPYGTDQYLACPICHRRLQLGQEHLAAVQHVRAATAVFRRGGVDQTQYLATVQRFWSTVGADPAGRQLVIAPATVPVGPRVAMTAPGAMARPTAPSLAPAAPPSVAQAASPTFPAAHAAQPPLTERLRTLAQLHADGVVTDEEYAAAKRRLLDG